VGIGNLALAVPPLKQALVVQFHRPGGTGFQVLLFGHSSVMQQLRKGTTGGATHAFSAFVMEKRFTSQLDLPALLGHLTCDPGTRVHPIAHRHDGGPPSSMRVTGKTQEDRHAPGPRGLPGAIHFASKNGSLTIGLPPRFSLEEAIRINQEGQRLTDRVH